MNIDQVARDTLSGKVSFSWIELTNGCNLNCVHCYSESSTKTFSQDTLRYDQYIDVIKTLYKHGCHHIQFIGGEPTLNKSLGKYITYAKSMTYQAIEVFSNLVQLKRHHIELFRDNDVLVATSLYSHDPETHDKITRKRGSFCATLCNIVKLREHGVRVRAGFIEMGENEGHFPSTKALLQPLEVPVGYDRVRDVGRGKNLPTSQRLCGHCASGSVCVGADGTVSPCIMSKDWALGSIRTEALNDIIAPVRLRETRRAMMEMFGKQSEFACAPDACRPKDQCGPGACHPQVEGPPTCFPQTRCSPDVFRP